MKKISLIISLIIFLLFTCACVDQSIKDEENSKNKNLENPRVVATSMSAVYILEKLDVDLIGIPESQIDDVPERYKDLPKIGVAMYPDIEVLKTLNPDFVFSPASLISDLLPKYEAAGLNYGFLNLNNVSGMFKTISDLGKLLNREEQAKALIDDYENFMKKYKEQLSEKPKKKVLILMGLPGSYVVATENSYAGSLVEMAGGENVYSGTQQQFLNVNPEDMLTKKPDVILRTAHAMPDEVMSMFKEDFENNDIWSHFDCVKDGKVFDLDYKKFGMSAKFNYKEALDDLKEVLYD